ncbi:unnamed protein product [Blumeria hordei]|uniref:protein-tyrosine-phosphatase n=1 Tax=Blumeria hordei TaxID=2867405 RepID=A0A383UIY4_BLUHO|nr:unnamed protein product [Blumeria hordei]
MSFTRISGNDDIFVGGVCALSRTLELRNAGITHIVSVFKSDSRTVKDCEGFKHLTIEVDDLENENILQSFEKSGNWIESALKERGKVFVHCAMGRSRSVTTVLAYLLRKTPQLSVQEALSMLRDSYPLAEPNSGFMAQLELYREMQCTPDITMHPKYQRWLFEQDCSSALAAGVPPETSPATDRTERRLRSFRHRRILATSAYFIQHTPKSKIENLKEEAVSNSTFDSSYPKELPSTCTTHFINPISWMKPFLDEGLLMGRLECPNQKCSAQVGRYSWQGQRCSCGTWVCPSFSLQKSRCDQVKVVK